jgi:cytochrome P450
MNIDYDPFSPVFRADPYPIYEKLRRFAPVYWAEQSGTWVVSRYDDVLAILKDTARFSSDAMGSVLPRPKPGNPRKRKAESHRPSIIVTDPPVHTALRNIVNRGFTPRQISAWKSTIEQVVGQCIETIRSNFRFDVIHQLAIPVPVIVIAHVLGVEPERYSDFRKWADIIAAGINGPKSHLGFVESGAAAASRELSQYLSGIIKKRTSDEGNDLISVLVRAREGEVLTAEETIVFANALVFAGTETTTNLIGNAANALLNHPETLKQVQSNPGLVAGVLEETLRWDAPVQYLFRRTTESVEIAGRILPKDTIVTVLIGSANRDEARWGRDAAEFKLDREPAAHLAFGFGAHFCLGAALARMEAGEAVGQLLPVLSNARRASDQIEYLDSFQFRGLHSLYMERT